MQRYPAYSIEILYLHLAPIHNILDELLVILENNANSYSSRQVGKRAQYSVCYRTYGHAREQSNE